MAHRATSWAWDLQLDTNRKMVLLALADMADENLSCYPGQERLASMTGMALRTVRRSLADLEQAGLIVRGRRNRADGTRTSDRYQLLVGHLPATVTTGQSEQDYRPLTTEPTGHSDRAKEPPSKNHQKNHQTRTPTEDAFDEAWKHWPRKVDKARALEEWRKAVEAHPTVDVSAEIIRHGDAHRAADTPQRFVKYLKNWLAEESWSNPLPTSDDDRSKRRDPDAWMNLGRTLDDFERDRDAKIAEIEARHRAEVEQRGKP